MITSVLDKMFYSLSGLGSHLHLIEYDNRLAFLKSYVIPELKVGEQVFDVGQIVKSVFSS